MCVASTWEYIMDANVGNNKQGWKASRMGDRMHGGGKVLHKVFSFRVESSK